MYPDGEFENHLSINQQLTFDFAVNYFKESKLSLGEPEMRTLGMLTNEGYTNLALLISDQCSSYIKAATFDDDSRDVFLERTEFTGSILKQLEDAYSFLELRDKFRTSYEGLRRIYFDDYPKQALREAIANAVAHREYALSGPTLVSMMPSYIEITSLGGLVPGITQEDLNANISMPRNKHLAALMYRLGIIEAWGTGIGRIRSSYEGMGSDVEILFTPNTFTLKLPNRNAPKDNADLSADSDVVLAAVEDGCNTRANIQEHTGFSQTKTISLLKELVNAGLLIKQGSSRNTHYALAGN